MEIALKGAGTDLSGGLPVFRFWAVPITAFFRFLSGSGVIELDVALDSEGKGNAVHSRAGVPPLLVVVVTVVTVAHVARRGLAFFRSEGRVTMAVAVCISVPDRELAG